MKRTILTSLLFLYPINVAHSRHDRLMLNANAAAMAASLINHSHTFHPCHVRRRLFGWIDEKLMIYFISFIAWRCLKKSQTVECAVNVGGILGTLVFIYFVLLRGYRREERSMEMYAEWQKYVHMGMHFIGIVGLTRCYKRFYYLDHE